ncbi:MAG: class I SAM-dependent methyltransferase [Acidobacteria bacterium]|nr:class I SAM-dependent methyltransferase [Acidobacteriota bacterium]
MEEIRPYLPAAGHDWLLPFYDPMVKLLGGEAARRALIEQAGLESGQRVLEIGCGTGTLAATIKRMHPTIDVAGLDPDPKALARATRKAVRENLRIEFKLGYAGELPYPAVSFDRVFSAFMFHHLPADEKSRMLREARRVLKPGGEFHMLDFEGPEESPGLVARLLHSNEHLADNSEVRVLAFMNQAALVMPQKVGRGKMLFGRTAYYRAAV